MPQALSIEQSIGGGSAELMYASNFDSGTIEPLAIKGVDSVAIVDIHPYDGRKTLRFNLYTNSVSPLIDPYTNKPCNNNPLNFNLAFKTAGESRSWNQTYIRYRIRFDDADNRDKNNAITRMKLGYLSDLLNELTGQSITSTQSAIFPTITAENECGVVSYSRNGASEGRYDPTPLWPSGAIQTGAVNRGFRYDGSWHLIEILHDKVANTFAMWFNGIKVLANLTQQQFLIDANGDMPVDSNFSIDQLSFFHADEEEWANSTDRTGIRGAGHIADFECWKGGIPRKYRFMPTLKTLSLKRNPGDNKLTSGYGLGNSGYDVYWLIGQSNMIGRSSIRAGIDDNYSAISGRVFQFGYNSQSISAATNPLDHVNENAGQMGMWLEFIKVKMANLAPNRQILLVPSAQGDTSLASNWSPGQALNTAAKARLASAMSQGAGTNVLKEVLWHQGEGDSLEADQHRTRIQAMYDNFVATASGMTINTPFICGTITSILSGSAVINASLQDFATANAAVHLVDMTDLAFNGDNIHYTNAALFTAGQRYGAVIG